MSTPRVTTARNPGRKSKMPPVSAAKPETKPGIIASAIGRPVERQPVDAEAKWQMVAEAAYYRAEKRGFVPGGELQDWLEAEAQFVIGPGN